MTEFIWQVISLKKTRRLSAAVVVVFVYSTKRPVNKYMLFFYLHQYYQGELTEENLDSVKGVLAYFQWL